MQEERIHLMGMDPVGLSEFVIDQGEPEFRARQLFKGIHQRRLESFEDFTDISKSFRERLSVIACLRTLNLVQRFVSNDGTRRYLFSTANGNPVETVFIPTRKRDTICFSSQSGCALNCDFCLTAKLGFLQNLSPGEIVEQIIYVLNDVYGIAKEMPHGTNLVAMGAGEPFNNFENLLKAVSIMKREDGLFIVPGRITVSTVGIVPKIYEFAKLNGRPHLAISLSAPNDELRNRLMPINKRWNIDDLMNAAAAFQNSLKQGERLTFEYVLLAGINDMDRHAAELASLLKRYGLDRVKINLIPHNSAEPLEYSPPSAERVAAFKQTLETSGVSAYVRKARGHDIFAACGQLAAFDPGEALAEVV
ncbi:MAG: 23S rRNA (adenine(2503)-C(2))-methyltransferase RlmN [Acidobacteriota bacterium]|nr:23S rRNA (adenine(2503)-C(2))-methyltransferase RlmN [Acidobacteriota bacterium]